MLKEGQRRLLNNDSEIVLLTGDRRLGKTYGIVNKALKYGGKWVFVANSKENMEKILKDTISNVIKPYEDNTTYLSNKNIIRLVDNRTNITTDFIVVSNANEVRGMSGIGYLVFENGIQFNYEVFNILKDQVRQVIIVPDIRANIEIINVGEDIIKDTESWKEQELKKLMKEFSSIPNSDNTTKTRQAILEMITKIKEM